MTPIIDCYWVEADIPNLTGVLSATQPEAPASLLNIIDFLGLVLGGPGDFVSRLIMGINGLTVWVIGFLTY